MFWIIAGSMGLVVILAVSWPMLRQSTLRLSYSVALVVFVPVATLFLYKDVGTPDGIDVNGIPRQQASVGPAQAEAGDMSDMIGQLEQRLLENPADLDGWMLLGRSYKAVQQYAQAETALLRAIQLSPQDPLVLVELAEAKLFASGEPVIGPGILGMLDQALGLDPNQQKALWLSGIAATQSGDDALAVELWERLVSLMDPVSGVSDSVQLQINQAKTRLGVDFVQQPSDQVATATDGDPQEAAWPGIDIQVTIDDADYSVPPGAVLYVIARNPLAPRPPAGVRRIADPVFPVKIHFSDSDSMMKEMPVSKLESLQLLARLSMSGNPIAGVRDLASTPLDTNLDPAGTVTLQIPASVQ